MKNKQYKKLRSEMRMVRIQLGDLEDILHSIRASAWMTAGINQSEDEPPRDDFVPKVGVNAIQARHIEEQVTTAADGLDNLIKTGGASPGSSLSDLGLQIARQELNRWHAEESKPKTNPPKNALNVMNQAQGQSAADYSAQTPTVRPDGGEPTEQTAVMVTYPGEEGEAQRSFYLDTHTREELGLQDSQYHLERVSEDGGRLRIVAGSAPYILPGEEENPVVQEWQRSHWKWQMTESEKKEDNK